MSKKNAEDIIKSALLVANTIKNSLDACVFCGGGNDFHLLDCETMKARRALGDIWIKDNVHNIVESNTSIIKHILNENNDILLNLIKETTYYCIDLKKGLSILMSLKTPKTTKKETSEINLYLSKEKIKLSKIFYDLHNNIICLNSLVDKETNNDLKKEDLKKILFSLQKVKNTIINSKINFFDKQDIFNSLIDMENLKKSFSNYDLVSTFRHLELNLIQHEEI